MDEDGQYICYQLFGSDFILITVNWEKTLWLRLRQRIPRSHFTPRNVKEDDILTIFDQANTYIDKMCQTSESVFELVSTEFSHSYSPSAHACTDLAHAQLRGFPHYYVCTRSV